VVANVDVANMQRNLTCRRQCNKLPSSPVYLLWPISAQRTEAS